EVAVVEGLEAAVHHAERRDRACVAFRAGRSDSSSQEGENSPVEERLVHRARELHRAHPVVEAHADIPMDLWRRRRAGELSPLRDDYLGRLREGGVKIEFLTVGGDMPVTMDGEGRPDERAREMIDDVVAEAEASEELRVVRTAGALDAVLAWDQVGL